MIVSYKKLWKLLIDNDMMKKDLQKSAGISWATVTKIRWIKEVSFLQADAWGISMTIEEIVHGESKKCCCRLLHTADCSQYRVTDD